MIVLCSTLSLDCVRANVWTAYHAPITCLRGAIVSFQDKFLRTHAASGVVPEYEGVLANVGREALCVFHQLLSAHLDGESAGVHEHANPRLPTCLYQVSDS